MKNSNKELLSQFKLPAYVAGKSFAEASQAIANKFKDRNDLTSNNTKKELLTRLSNAQEYLKSQQQPDEQEAVNNPQEESMEQQMAFGGFEDSTIGKGFAKGATSGDQASGAGAVVDVLGTGVKLFDTAFGKPSQNTFGNAQSAPVDSKGMLISSALQGAEAGSKFGLVGAGVGLITGLGAGLLGDNKAKEAAIRNSGNFAYKQNNMLSDQYAMGGKMETHQMDGYRMAGKTHPYKMGGKMDAYAMGGKMNKYDDGGFGIDGKFIKPAIKTREELSNPTPFVMPNTKPDIIKYQMSKGLSADQATGNIGAATRGFINSDILNSTPQETDPTNILAAQSKPFVQPTGVKAAFEKYAINNPVVQNKTFGQKASDFANDNYANALRLSPALMNAIQLKNLKRPDGVVLNKLDNRFTPTYADTAQQQNIVNQELNNAYSAIQQSGASEGAIRSNLLGAQLNKTRALSGAFAGAQQQNAQQNAMAQQFNAGIDQTNLQQANSQQDINDRNRGNYDTQKSKLQSQIGEDLGNIGKEQLFKQYPKMMGLGYNYNGKYFVNDKGDIKTKEQAAAMEKVNPSAYGGFLNDDLLGHINTMYAKRNKR